MSIMDQSFQESGGVRGLSYSEACLVAKQQLCALGWHKCATATCDDVVAELCSNCSIFTGSDPNRLALTGSYNCPISPCPATGGGGGSSNTALLIGGLAALAAIAAVVATRGPKKVMIARVQK